MKVITVTNQKGGVAKTTTTASFGYELAEFGNRVLLIDLDPQCNLSQYLNVSDESDDKSMYNVLCGKAKISDVIKSSENVDIVASDLLLAGAEQEMNKPGREYKLKESLSEIKDRYDYIIMDCPPSLGLITTNALTASNSVIIPVQCEFFALEGIMQLLNTIMMAQKNLNPNLDIEGVLLTMLDSRTNLGFEVVDDIRKYFKERVYNTIIPRLIRLTEAPSHGKPIVVYDPKSKGTEAYLNLAKEVIERNGAS